MPNVDMMIAVVAVLLVVGLPIALVVFFIQFISRSERLDRVERRLFQLENRVHKFTEAAAPPVPTAEPPPIAAEVVPDTPPTQPPDASAPRPSPPPPSPWSTSSPAPNLTARAWELILGRSVLGWVALVAFVLASATFLKYAFENDWIGPQGQLSIILAGGLFVLWLGYRRALKGWRLFAQILLSAGLVVIYLATYATFGFYHVVTQQTGMVFLIVIVVEAAALALVYDAWSVALVALLGGLATPLLISSPYDQLLTLFTYILVLNLGTLLILWRRPWPALATIALVGAHFLYWTWYGEFYHPEKLAWAIGFQAALWALHLGYHACAFIWGRRKLRAEDLVRLLLGLVFGFAQVYNLLRPEYSPYLGTFALLLAIVYAALAHAAFRARPDEEAGLLTLIAAVLGLVGITIPLEARVHWISLGWAIVGAALWWFGIRIERAALRSIAAVFGVLAVLRLLTVDMHRSVPDDFVPVLNEFALPALGVVACLLTSIILTWDRSRRLDETERGGAMFAGVAGVVLLGWVISLDLFRWFVTQSWLTGNRDWAWGGQVAVSIWWAIYASVLLTIGFRANRPVARWLALGLFALTALKVFFVDMASVGELFRILALFVLAILMGGAAWAYQRVRLSGQSSSGIESQG